MRPVARSRFRPLSASLATVLAAAACAAPAERSGASVAEPRISTDRPGLLNAPTLVPRGRVQVEAGLPTLTLVRDAGDEQRMWSLPVALRYGLTDAVELRASLPPYDELRDESGGTVATERGFGDAELGVKLALAPLASGPTALLASLRLPTGEDGFTTGEVGGSAYLLHGRTLSGAWWLQSLLGASFLPTSGAADVISGALAALVSHPIAERASAYVEGTAVPGLRNAAGQSYAGAGLVWIPLDRLQLDLSGDFGLDDDSADAIVSFGISFFF